MGPASARIQYFVFITPFILSTLVGLLVPKFGVLGFFTIMTAFIGSVLILYSKIFLKLRSKKVIEWGMSGMTVKERYCYIAGYIF